MRRRLAMDILHHVEGYCLHRALERLGTDDRQSRCYLEAANLARDRWIELYKEEAGIPASQGSSPSQGQEPAIEPIAGS